MMNTFSYLLTLIILSMTLTMILYYLSYNSIIDREKISPFEYSFDPFESLQIPFSSHFFYCCYFSHLYVELVIIMPMIIVMSNVNIMCTILNMFMLILIFGMFHEWNNKMLNWL